MPEIAEPTAGVERVVHASAAKIWMALTSQASLKQFFFGAEVLTDWKVGSPIRMKGEFNGKPYEDKGEIIAFEPQTRLSFSHWSAMSGAADTPENYHIVSFDLAPDGEGTKVILTQANLVGGVTAADMAHRAEYEKNWSSVLDGLEKIFP
jgi:uncharacterized protein YndB with AHSA1/START domain